MTAAAENDRHWERVTKLLLNNGRDFAITEKAMIAAAENVGDILSKGDKVIGLLLTLDNGRSVPITEKVLLAAAKNNSYAETIIGQLIDCGNDGAALSPRK
jgi:hypothetical protein